MPELPEVETVRQTLRGLVLGKKINAVEVYYERIIEGDAATFTKTVEGQTIKEIDRVGKYLIFLLNQDAFVSHLRMEGKYLYFKKNDDDQYSVNRDDHKKTEVKQSFQDVRSQENNAKMTEEIRDKHIHLIFTFTDGSRLCYRDTRKFGRLQLVDKKDFKNKPPLAKLGPEPWDADVDQVYAKIHRSSLPIKTLLLDQSIMTGIGNIYANEICFQLKMHPKTPGKRLSKKRVAELIVAAQEILDQAIAQGGTTIHSFSSDGIDGRFQVHLQAHMQTVCPCCGGSMTKEQVNGRGTYYCKVCQKRRG